MNFRIFFLALSLILGQHVIAQDDLELRVQVLESTVVQINDEVDDVESAVALNTEQLFEVGNDVDDIDDQTDAQELRIGAVEEENSILRARLDQMEILLTSLSSDIVGLDMDVKALNETVSDLDTGSDNSTNDRLDALEGDVTTLENDVTTLGSDVTQLDSDVTDLGNGLSVLEADVTEVESSLQVLNSTTDQRLDELEENNGGGEDYSHTAFLASHSADNFAPSNPIVWDSAILNPGGHYNPESGIYTVPVDGIYQFVFHLRNANDYCSGSYLEVDYITVAYLYNCEDTYYAANEMTILLSLTAGQGVWTSPSGLDGARGTTSSGILYSWFSGHLIYPL